MLLSELARLFACLWLSTANFADSFVTLGRSLAQQTPLILVVSLQFSRIFCSWQPNQLNSMALLAVVGSTAKEILLPKSATKTSETLLPLCKWIRNFGMSVCTSVLKTEATTAQIAKCLKA